MNSKSCRVASSHHVREIFLKLIYSFLNSVASASPANSTELPIWQYFMLTSVLHVSVRRANLSVLRKRLHHGVVVSSINNCRWRFTRSFLSTSKVSADVIEEKIFPTEKIRNIAIIAHGKFYYFCAGGVRSSCAWQLITARPLWLISSYANREPSNNSRKLSRLSSP